jgi:hypothetical protein
MRIKATLIHLVITLALLVGTLILVSFFLYPGFHSRDTAFIRIAVILIGVQLALGPLVTAVTFNPKKKYLKPELAVRTGIEVAALAYGIAILVAARPAYVVYNVDRLTVVSATAIPQSELDKAPAQYNTLPIAGPELVGTRIPVDRQEQERLMLMSVSSGIDLPQLPKYYVAYDAMAEEVKHGLQSLETLMERKPEYRSLIEAALSDLKEPAGAVGYLPVTGKSKDFIAIVSRDNARILKYLAVDSW